MTTQSKFYYIAGAACNSIVEYKDETVVIPFEKKNHISVCSSEKILVYNSVTGTISEIDFEKDFQEVINFSVSNKFKGLSCFSFTKEHFYFTDSHGYLLKYDQGFNFISETKLSFIPTSFTVNKNDFFFYDRKSGMLQIMKIEADKLDKIFEFALKGIGQKAFAFKAGELWVTDDEENTVSIYEKETGKLKNCMVTPYVSPVGIAFVKDAVYIAYNGSVMSNSYDNLCFPEQKPFFHKLIFKTVTSKRCKYTISNPFVIEFSYEEKISLKSLELVHEKLFAEIALPVNNDRQQVLEIKPIGRNFKIIEREDGKKFAQFNLGTIDKNSGGVIGYKALLKLSGIKYLPIIDPGFSMYDLSETSLAKEIEEEEGLQMWNPFIKEFASVPMASSIAETVKTIRDKVFKALYYRPNTHARDLEDVIRDGYGACGDYTSIIMACCRLNEIPVRSRGGFKVPRFTNAQNESLTCLYNHVWLEFYYPGIGWLPFESSSDDKEFNGRLCEGQFLGEDWTHLKTHENQSTPNFITCRTSKGEVHPYDVFENNINFRVLGETEI